MMRYINKKIIVFIALLLVVIILSTITTNNKSYSNLQVQYSHPDNITLDVTSIDTGEVTSITNMENVRLKNGNYSIMIGADNNDYVIDSKDLNLLNDTVLPINIYYSENKLQDELNEHKQAINDLVNDKFIVNNINYMIRKVQLFNRADWAGVTLMPNVSQTDLESDYYDEYRVILRLNNQTWEIATNNPEITFNKKDLPEIPINVLDGVNNLTTYSE